ncbi:PAS domain-containing hybrid sensor histidine kinase/response regulator [Enterovirga sp.]|uniref:hybrid sensor histidine kinase/response regulator n=1 Tax=Enterovirga sp. TaxID=2026350 RepID=UPI002B972594|nr:PAS domain-containing hybrid sensor histidine kinase/response regulator [Enterovirga sp.]HMO27777.1 PAS domain-containing hybrid sensor histidine kinase/response regulator [Enterovirga sp.]
MTERWTVILTALVYLCFLFAIAHWGDLAGRRIMRRGVRATIYALALAVYCTSWTFYGSVGLASHDGLDFLAIYIGPVLVIGFCMPFVQRVLRIAKAQNITSVADFVAARYGKSEGVAALVCLIALVGTIPYIALQLKAVASSLSVFLGEPEVDLSAGMPGFADLALVIALVLAGFAVAFGTRHADATEHQDGLVVAIAVESIVKLAAFLTVGFFVVYGLFEGFQDIADRFPRDTPVFLLLGPTSSLPNFLTLVLLSSCAALLLPRQFHMTVVENRAASDVRKAAWLFPLYLVLINVFVVPIALAGLYLLPAEADRDMTVLALPLQVNENGIALLTFVGGLSAATAMVIVDTVAVSIMVSNHLVLPLMLRRRDFAAGEQEGGEPRNLGSFVLATRRIAIVAITLLGYLYYRVAGDNALASIGLLSFAAVAQIAPAFFGGLFWRGGTARGANAGLLIGIALWAYTLLLPVLIVGTGLEGLLRDGPFGIGALNPTGLLGTDLPRLTHGTLWSLGLNLATYVGVSLLGSAGALERIQAAAFVGDRSIPISPALRIFRSHVTVDELRTTVGRFLGHDRTSRSFAGYARSRGLALEGRGEADIHLLRYAEHLLASAIGAGSSRLALSLALRGSNVSGSDALKLLDDASAALKHNRDLLQHALDHSQQGITVLDADLRLLAWNQAFIDLYGFPPDLIRIGVGLEEIIRTNAERGVYGSGSADEVIAQRLHSMLHEEGPVRVRLISGRVISIRSNKLPGGGLIAIYTDVSEAAAEEERREREHETLEARVRERTEELTRLNEELRRATLEADEANASKTRFLAAASHDILQPLNAARLYATAFLERARHTTDAQLAENIDASLDAVEEILTTLLDISRLDSGALVPQYSAIALDELFRQLEREFGPVAAEKGLRLRFVHTSLAVRSDRRLLRRLLQNLVSNGIKYTPSGKVLVGIRRRGDKLRLEVWDTGLGIRPEQRKAIFREFERLPEGAREARGLGLGLSIVDRIAKALNVGVGLRSAPERGSAFSVELPRTEIAEREERLQASRRPATPLVDLSVLAIDNEPAVRDGMLSLLCGWGCEVVTAGSLDEAMVALERGARPNVLIADYHLDEGDGLAAVAAIRAHLGRDLPAILITADRSPELAEAAEAARVSVLNKPLKPAALRALLGRVQATGIAAE